MTATFKILFIYFVWRLITVLSWFLPNINMNLKNRNYLILSEYFFSFFMGWAGRALSTYGYEFNTPKWSQVLLLLIFNKNKAKETQGRLGF